jgi:putative alpha-1,2-mannosidase
MATTQAQAPVADLVDPFWGSTLGNVVPGVSVPFGMVKLSPNVPSPQAWQSTSGYEQGKLYAGFSHTHTSGTGGGSEIYSYYVPHDMAGLVQRHGGAQAFVKHLDAFFDEGRFDLGNEPLFLVPYSYHYAGMPHKTAERVRQLLSRDFTTGHQGLPGQDDSGAMSAWYVWSSAGIFPVAGQPLYLIGSPVFSKFTFRLGGAKSFTVEAVPQQPGAIYVQSASLNGQPLQRAWITHDELMQGGTLRLTMGSTPGHWGRSQLPFSLSTHPK